MAVKDKVRANPVTTVTGVGGLVTLLGTLLGWDSELIATVTSATIVVALAVRAVVAWWESRHAADPGV